METHPHERSPSSRSLVLPLNTGLGWQVLSDFFTPHFSGDLFPGSSAIRKSYKKGMSSEKRFSMSWKLDVFSRHLAFHDIFSLAASPFWPVAERAL